MKKRIFVEKREQFQVEAESIRSDLNRSLSINIESLRLVNVYDLFGFNEELIERSKYGLFGEIVTDIVTEQLDLEGKRYIAIETLPGQFDPRASSAVDCVRLIDYDANVEIKSAKIIIFESEISEKDLERAKNYLINRVECREKNLDQLDAMEQPEIEPVVILEGFRELAESEYSNYCKQRGLAMNEADLSCVVDYFKKEGRDPYETELRILDTYWSDHCRHTTFTSIVEEI